MRSPTADSGVLSAAVLQWLDTLAPLGIFTTDRDLVIRTWNRWLEVNTGHTAAEVIGRLVFEAFPELERRGFREYYDAALAGQVTVLAHGLHRYIVPVRDADPRIVRQSGRIGPLDAAGGIVGTVTVVDDVSERVLSERELRTQIEASDRARALAEEAVRVKDEFLTTLSHEIRTPLNAVLGWTRILLARRAEPDMLSRALEIIDRNALAQVRLIDDMLDTARIMSGKLRLDSQPVDLVRVVRAAVDVVQPTAVAKNVTIRDEIGSEPLMMRGDPDRLQQIAWNLLANAVKFTDSQGQVRVNVAQAGASLVLTVSDTGEGVAADFLPVIFERFRQADPSATRRHAGLGIGLSLVRQLVELHGGRIAVTSEVGVGSVFTVTFPCLAEFAGTGDASAAAPSSMTLADLRILVVDDQIDGREMLTVALEQHGAQVTGVSTAAELLVLLDRTSRYDLPHAIVVDVHEADDAALAVISALGRRSAGRGGEIPVLAVTSHGSAQLKCRVLAAGFHAHLAKPLSPETLATAVRNLVRAS